MDKPKIKLQSHVKIFIEGELREYRTMKAMLEQLKKDKEDIYNRLNQPKEEPVRGSHPGDPTSAAVILAEKIQREIKWLERRIGKIEAGIKTCTDREKTLIEIKYFNPTEPTDDEVMDYMRIGYRSGYFQLKFSALSKIAKVYGVLAG